MSAIGEARGFSKEAVRLRKRLATEQLTPDERAKLIEQAVWFEEESDHCWRYADQEARADEYAERMEQEREDDDDE